MTSTGLFFPRRNPRRDKLVVVPIGLMLFNFKCEIYEYVTCWRILKKVLENGFKGRGILLCTSLEVYRLGSRKLIGSDALGN